MKHLIIRIGFVGLFFSGMAFCLHQGSMLQAAGFAGMLLVSFSEKFFHREAWNFQKLKSRDTASARNILRHYRIWSGCLLSAVCASFCIALGTTLVNHLVGTISAVVLLFSTMLYAIVITAFVLRELVSLQLVIVGK